jgi:hypothetical protein
MNFARERFSRVIQGPESVEVAQAVRDQEQSKVRWPYPWVFPPRGAIRVTAGADTSGTLAVPVAATPTQGLVYVVEQGFQFVLQAIVVQYLKSGALGFPNPGDFTWSLTLNKPFGVASFQGNFVQGFTNVDVPLGSLQIPWPLVCGDIMAPNDSLAIVFNNVNLNSGAPNFFKALFLGWKWPVGPDSTCR